MEPKKLAIYYGWPSTVKDWTVNGAASVFKDYDLLVLGAGLEDASHGDHENTEDIINHTDMANTEVYGYVTAQTSQSANETKIDNWYAMGATGIFCDEFGYDFGTSRSDQNDLIDYVHSKGLKAFVNSWDPDDALGSDVDATYNPTGTGPALSTTDWYLAESFAVKDDDYDDTDSNSDNVPDWKDKADKLVNYSNDINIACIASVGTSTGSFVQAKADYSYYITSMFGFDAWGWGEKNYSSAGGPSSLPFRSRKTLPEGDELRGEITGGTGDIYERRTNVGFHIDIDNHTVSDRLD